MNTENIPESVLSNTKVSGKGYAYVPFDFAFANMKISGFIRKPKRGIIELIEKGRNFKHNSQMLTDQVYKISLPEWENRSKRNNKQLENLQENPTDDNFEDNWRSGLLTTFTN